MACALVAVFVLAAWINPYGADGQALRLETHTQLGLQPCGFYRMTGQPCPACGMTTSFALLMHGDVLNSLRANWVGTLVALVWLASIPWGIWSSLRGRYLWVRSLEWPLVVLVGTLTGLMLVRWLFVLAWSALGG
jgi:hypothetical protein